MQAHQDLEILLFGNDLMKLKAREMSLFNYG